MHTQAQKPFIEGNEPTLASKVQGITDYSTSNRHADFQVFEGGIDTAGYHNEEDIPRLKAGIERGFLATRWLKAADYKLGLLMSDTDYYTIHCSERLADILQHADYINAIRAICSFQILTDGSKRVICQVFYKTPFVR